MRLTQFGTLLLPETDGEDSLPFGIRSVMADLPDGAYDLDGASAVRKRRTFSRRFTVMATETQTIQEQIDALVAEWSRGYRLLRGETRDGQLRQTFAKISDVEYDHRPGNAGYQPITVTFEVPFPVWLASADEPEYLDDGLALDSGWVLNAGQLEDRSITASPHQWTITNGGALPVTRGFILIAPQTGGSIQNVKVANAANNMWFQYVGTLVGSSGDDLFIDLLAHTVLLNGDPGYDAFYLGDAQARFMVLEVGGNAITVTADSVTGTTKLYWQWSKTYAL